MLLCHLIIACARTMAKKSFKDLVFNNNVAKLELKNGYVVIVRKGRGTATTYGAPYEFELVPANPIVAEDIVGYCTEDDITMLIHESIKLKN